MVVLIAWQLQGTMRQPQRCVMAVYTHHKSRQEPSQIPYIVLWYALCILHLSLVAFAFLKTRTCESSWHALRWTSKTRHKNAMALNDTCKHHWPRQTQQQLEQTTRKGSRVITCRNIIDRFIINTFNNRRLVAFLLIILCHHSGGGDHNLQRLK